MTILDFIFFILPSPDSWKKARDLDEYLKIKCGWPDTTVNKFHVLHQSIVTHFGYVYKSIIYTHIIFDKFRKHGFSMHYAVNSDVLKTHVCMPVIRTGKLTCLSVLGSVSQTENLQCTLLI